jgi:hypothetical protein
MCAQRSDTVSARDGRRRRVRPPRPRLLAKEDDVTEKAMFARLAFLGGGHMAVGISNAAELVVRVGPDATDDACRDPTRGRSTRPAGR